MLCKIFSNYSILFFFNLSKIFSESVSSFGFVCLPLSLPLSLILVTPSRFPSVGLKYVLKVSFSVEFSGEHVPGMVLMLAAQKANVKCTTHILKNK